MAKMNVSNLTVNGQVLPEIRNGVQTDSTVDPGGAIPYPNSTKCEALKWESLGVYIPPTPTEGQLWYEAGEFGSSGFLSPDDLRLAIETEYSDKLLSIDHGIAKEMKPLAGDQEEVE